MLANDFYCPDSMSAKSHKDFESWYAAQVENNTTYLTLKKKS